MTFRTRNIRLSERRKNFKRAISTGIQAVTTGFGRVFRSGVSKTTSLFKRDTAFFRNRKNGYRRRWIVGSLLIGLGCFVVFETSMRVINFFQNFELKDLLWLVGTDLPTDEHGMTNVLLLGIGGGAHDGSTLTDTIIIGSIDHKTESIVLLSLPRDFYVETDVTSGRINEVVRDVMSGYSRDAQDEGYNQGIEVLKKKIEEVTTLQIHRYAQIDFSGFAEGVDTLGGIDVVVEKAIDDPTYPDENWGYERFVLGVGPQHLDGDTALKYVRSRHGSSDFDRSRRQRKVLEAVQEKAISKEILTSPKKLKELYVTFEKNVKTDLSWGEMVSLAKVAYRYPKENILSFGLNDNETEPGGFLVTPARDLYGGAFVLVPFLNLTKDKYARIQTFAENIFRHREFLLKKVRITVLNGTNFPGFAGETATHLERFGIAVDKVDNSEANLEKTQIRFSDTPENRAAAEFLKRYFVADLIPLHPTGDAPQNGVSNEITVVVGRNHQNYRIPLVPETPLLGSP